MPVETLPAADDTHITLDDYLHRNYESERECEFVDGKLEERTGGETPHGILHAAAASWFWQLRAEWNIDCAMSYSMWVSPTRIRVSDIVVMNDKLRENIRITPPLLCIEILAPEDIPARLLPRLDDFVAMGVAHIWPLDPIDRTAFTYTNAGLKLADSARLTVPNSPIYLDLPEIFSALD
jgi:Uma2 family endonuclease